MGEACAVCIKPCFHGGKCLVAALDFDVGEVVLEETPLLEMPDEQVLAFKTTSHYAAVWLYAQHYISQEKFQQLLQLGLSEGAATSGKAQEAKEALMEVPESEDALRFLIILMSNSFRFKGVNGSTTALFELISRINHSCVPNVRMIGDGRPAQLVAVRPIKQQDELLLCYGGWETAFLKSSWRDRQRHLFHNWGFTCACPRCEDDSRNSLGET
eukprot:symbB.v1.2.008789.t1/scaffold536.1/size343967/5